MVFPPPHPSGPPEPFLTIKLSTFQLLWVTSFEVLMSRGEDEERLQSSLGRRNSMLVPCPEDDTECEGIVLGAGTQRTLHAHLPVIEGCLYLACQPMGCNARPQRGEVFVSMHRRMNYVPFCADFGPLNLGATCQMCRKLRVLLSNPSLKGSKIVYVTSTVTD